MLVASCSTLAAAAAAFLWGGRLPRYQSSWVRSICGRRLLGRKTILQKDTFYHRIRIEEDDEARYMYFDRTLQSAMNLKDPAALRLLYSRYTSLGFAFRPDAKKMLIIGLGGGSIPKKAQKEFPNMEIDAVEIDPEVVKIAKDHFNVKEGKNLRIHAQDGRLFLSTNAEPIRHHPARRLFHRRHAVSSCDQGIF